MRLAIMGAGSIGGIVGSRFANSGMDVLFIARGAHLQAMKTTGLKVSSDRGDLHLSRVSVTDNPIGHGIVDFVIFTVKGPDTRVAANLIRPLVGVNTGIISFQNGIDGIDVLAAEYSSSNVMPGTTITTATVEAPGHLRHFGSGNKLTIGEMDKSISARAMAFRDAAAAADLVVHVSPDILVDIWSKFTTTAAVAAVTCLTRLPVRTCARSPELKKLMLDAMNEVVAVASARQITLPHDIADRIFMAVETVDPSWKSSMCNDLEAGKAIEVESVAGALHRLGQSLGVPTPTHSFVYRVLKYFTTPPAER